MTLNDDVKEYRPKDISNPYIIIPIMLVCIWVGVNAIFKAYTQVSLAKYIYFLIIFGGGSLLFVYLIYANIRNSIYIHTTETDITGWNVFKVKRCSIEFAEITHIQITTKRVINLIIKDINSNKITMSFCREFVLLLGEILEKSTNCENIDIDFKILLKQGRYPGIESIRDKWNSDGVNLSQHTP